MTINFLSGPLVFREIETHVYFLFFFGFYSFPPKLPIGLAATCYGCELLRKSFFFFKRSFFTNFYSYSCCYQEFYQKLHRLLREFRPSSSLLHAANQSVEIQLQSKSLSRSTPVLQSDAHSLSALQTGAESYLQNKRRRTAIFKVFTAKSSIQ